MSDLTARELEVLLLDAAEGCEPVAHLASRLDDLGVPAELAVRELGRLWDHEVIQFDVLDADPEAELPTLLRRPLFEDETRELLSSWHEQSDPAGPFVTLTMSGVDYLAACDEFPAARAALLQRDAAREPEAPVETQVPTAWAVAVIGSVLALLAFAFFRA